MGHIEFNHERDFPVVIFRSPLAEKTWTRVPNVGVISSRAVVHWSLGRLGGEGVRKGPWGVVAHMGHIWGSLNIEGDFKEGNEEYQMPLREPGKWR